ncbi:MAG: SDR family NAD(P)-dependent oxidoreductase [Rhodospirillales bacterium]|nr:SDR family NAD(P)-dependent oxidoreductase [Rhodospirillales bacterium]
MTALAGRIALVTGASRGIGRAVAVELARRGAQVVITARSQGGLEETDDAIRAAGGSATLLPLDLMDGAALDRLGPSLFERFRQLDILVGNAAALGLLTPVPHIQDRDWAEVVGVNLAAGLRLIRSCAPLLLAGEAGRAVFVTSGIVRRPTAYWGAYGATKAALEHLVLSWAEETRRTRLRVNLFDPGVVATRLRATAMPGEDPATLRRPEEVAPALADLCAPAETRHGEVVRFGA